MTSKKTLVCAALLASMMASSHIAMAQDTTATNKDGTAAPTAVLLVVPIAFAANDQLGNGCWVRLYDGANFTGSQYVLVGPVDIPAMRDGLGISEKYDSVIVGPKATVTLYDNNNYRDRSAVLKAASRTPDLDDKMGLFETIRSVKISCAM